MTTKNPGLSRDALFAKSQVYIRRGLRAMADGQPDEHQLWASLALELLGKAALSQVHPALVADPTHYQSLFAACGRELSPDLKTITAKTLFERLTHIDRAFDDRHRHFCEQLALKRNAELHSGESPFSGSGELWQRDFWGAVATLLSMQDETLESWLGAVYAKDPTELLGETASALEWVVEHRTDRHRTEFAAQHKDPKQREKLITASQSSTWMATWDGQDRLLCPACGALGFLGGKRWHEEAIETEMEVEHFEDKQPRTHLIPVEILRTTFTTEEFLCVTCGLRFYGRHELSAAGIPGEFQSEEEREREFEADYGND